MVTSNINPPEETRKMTSKEMDAYNKMTMSISALYGLASVFAETEKMQHVSATICKLADDINDCLEDLFKK